jgi:hypothetical protein
MHQKLPSHLVQASFQLYCLDQYPHEPLLTLDAGREILLLEVPRCWASMNPMPLPLVLLLLREVFVVWDPNKAALIVYFVFSSQILALILN